MKRKDIIDISIEFLRGYCKKHADCTNCRFVDNIGDCMFEHLMPCDWSDKPNDK